MTSQKTTFDGIERLEKTNSVTDIDLEILSRLQVDINEIKKEGLYIFGVGTLGQKIHKFLTKINIGIKGYVDNNSRFHGQQLDGSTIFNANVLTSESIIYIASETYSYAIQHQLNKLDLLRTVTHFQGGIIFKSVEGFPFDNFYSGITQDLIINKEKYLQIFSLLKDEQSKVVFDRLIGYRLTADTEKIQFIASEGSLEYFDPSIMTLGESEVFMDCGGFDGDSALNFITYTGFKYKSIHIFEPDHQLLTKAKERLKEFERISYNEKGIFDKTATLYFNSTGGLDGSINNVGNIKIETVSIDQYKFEDIPTYIKLDIEGVEIEALNGAIKTIKNHTPKLAIAGYHYPKHFWEIPLRVLEINTGYSLHLRHYSNCLFGSTYYFIPK